MKIILFLCLIALIWGFFIEPRFIFVKKYKLQNNDLKGCRAIFVSDLHIAPNQQKRLQKIVKLINKQKADIVFSTGDFVRGYKKEKTLPIEPRLVA